jgi:pyruvate/2-oxoglutarate dehydrogenase complex dihydrolipoamide acyltransferase (E2) component
MANLPRPMIGLLVATIAFFAVWTVALKPSSSSGPASSSSSPAPAASQPKAAAPAHADASSASAAKATPAAKAAVKHTASPQQRQTVIENGLNHHKVVAILFFNPAAADDRAVKHELDEVPARGGKIVKLAVPLSELTRYPVITNQVQVTESPTLVLIDGQRKADMLTGFLDQLELSQRVSDALTVK